MVANTVATSGTTSFYSHSTELGNRDTATLCMTSLNYPQLQLRLPVPEDAPALLHIFSDPQNVQYDKSCAGLTNPEAIAALIQSWHAIGPPLERANVVVVVDGAVVGTSGLGWIGKRQSYEKWIGYAGMMLNSECRGKGYAYEALCMVIDHGFRVLGMDEVGVACQDANVSFKGLMNVKFGFNAEGCEDRFGNAWKWLVTKQMWMESPHCAEARYEI